MTNVTVLVAAKTDVGRVRTNNEDAYSLFDLTRAAQVEANSLAVELEVGASGLLLSLSDGMGGHQAGEVASALVLESLRGALTVDTDEPVASRLDAAVRKANAEVFRTAQDGNRKGMGATLTALFIQGSEAHLAQVGDSRLYLVRSGQLRQLSRDQSLVQLLVDGGAISPEEAKHSPQKNVILQAVGLAADVKVAIARLQLRREDIVLLCCDGLSNAITDEELLRILVDGAPMSACERLIGLANERGGEDNLTAIVARIGGGDLPLPGSHDSVAGTFEVLQEPSRPPANARPAAPLPAVVNPEPEAPSNRAESQGSASTRPDRSLAPATLVTIAIACVLAMGAAAYWWLGG